MSLPNDTTLQQQQAAQRAAAMAQAQKANKPQSTATVKFAEVLKSQQKPTTSSKLLKENPVAGNEVVKSAIKASGSKQGKLAVAANANSSSGTSGSTSGSTGSSSTATGADGSSTDASIKASYNLMELNQDFNLQYLNLQESMQAESRQYTAMSNVSKTKTDTAKNSLSNVK